MTSGSQHLRPVLTQVNQAHQVILIPENRIYSIYDYLSQELKRTGEVQNLPFNEFIVDPSGF